ncbi:MAG TPA: response regulator [Steroidobacteraceae bacterium]|nr:response regulator [Steroidobacteraceae bacterium]
MRTLLIEDDRMIGKSLAKALRGAGLAVDWVRDGVAGDAALAAGGYVAVLLDLGLPRRAGLEVLAAARSRGDRTPILILTARDAVTDRVAGLDLGADDYIVKPFELSELLARLRAAIRRSDGHAQSLIGSGELQLDLLTREIVYRSTRAALSAREFALLHALLERPGTVLSRQQLEERIYGWDDAVSSNAVEVIIHGLRRRFGADVIRNVRGLGWKVRKSGS